MLETIYDALIADHLIREKADGRIKFYQYPETSDVSETHIIISPIDAPMPSDYADNKWLMEDFMYQIDVWSKSREDRDAIAKRIQDIMWEINFINYGGGIDDYDSITGIYRDARRYRGKSYITKE